MLYKFGELFMRHLYFKCLKMIISNYAFKPVFLKTLRSINIKKKFFELYNSMFYLNPIFEDKNSNLCNVLPSL